MYLFFRAESCCVMTNTSTSQKKGLAMYPLSVPQEHFSIITERTMNQFAHMCQEQLVQFMRY